MPKIKTTNDLVIETGTTYSVDSTSAASVNSSGGAINVGNNANAQPINIGTGAAARTITIGNATGATGVSVNTGTGAANFGTNATAHTTTVGSITGASTTNIQSGTGGLNVGTGAIARTITIGNTTGVTAVNMNIGTGDFTMASASGTLVSQLDTGEMTQPLQPAFLAELGSTDSNVTGAGATYKVGTNVAFTERYDQGSDFNTNGTFTAPVTGRYLLSAMCRFAGITSAMTGSNTALSTSNRVYFYNANPANLRTVADIYSVMITVIADMDAADTAHLDVTILNGAGNTADIDPPGIWFCGKLAC